MQKDMQAADDKCEKMEKQHSWISSEQQFFGRPGSDYDWASTDVDAAFAEYQELELAQQKRTKKGINQTVRAPVACPTESGSSYLFGHVTIISGLCVPRLPAPPNLDLATFLGV
jgi:hypothetical protein